MGRLAELLFVEALRCYIRQLPEEQRGWLAGLRDPHVGKALALMHARPDQDWQVDSLASGVGLSRSALADRFSALIGEPPMQYLARWRMALAAQYLARTNDAGRASASASDMNRKPRSIAPSNASSAPHRPPGAAAHGSACHSRVKRSEGPQAHHQADDAGGENRAMARGQFPGRLW